jgi:Family of unknown function (DUF6790)
MIPVFLFCIALVLSLVHVWIKKQTDSSTTASIFLSYIVLFNVGMMGLLAFYAHVFMAQATAEKIGWMPGSPFQFEVAMANLSYGVLDVLAFFIRKSFMTATVMGYCILLVGAFVGYLIQYSHGDTQGLLIKIS